MAIDKCLLTKGLTREGGICNYSLKQINEIYLANYSDVETKISPDEADGYTVKSITGTAKWYKFEPAKDTSSYNDDLVIGGNGSKYRTHTMTFSFNGSYDAGVATVLDNLSLGKFVAVLKLSDGSAIMLGRMTGLEASAASSLSEAAADGQNGITVTLECNTVEPALPVAKDALDSIVATTKEDEGEGA